MKLVRAGLYLIFVLMVLAYGGVEVWSNSILEAGAGLLFVIWAVSVFRDRSLKIIWNPLCWPLLALVLIAVIQLAARITANPFLTRVEI
jgi:hypothetical protein